MASHLSRFDGIEVRYSRFHSVHGRNIVLSENGCVARRERGYDKAIVYSSSPIPLDDIFQLAIGSEEQEWSGSLRFGVTTCNPDMLDHIPATAIECYGKREYWVLSDNHLYHNGKMKKSLISMQGLTVGSTVGCRVTVKGRLDIFLNGINLGITWDGLPTSRPIWGFADLYGKTVEVRSNFMCEPSYSKPELSIASNASSRLGFNTQSSLPSYLAAKVDSHNDEVIQQRDETIAALQQELAAERQSKEELTRTWKMANEEFMRMQMDQGQEMKEIYQQLDVAQRQLKTFQIHVQQVLGLQQSVPNGKSHNTLSGNEQDSIHSAQTDSNSVYSMLHALKERLHELLTELEGTAACDDCSDVAQRQTTIPLPSTVKEGVTVNSLLSSLKLRIKDCQQEGQFLRIERESQKKQIEVLEADVTRYQAALAQMENESRTIGSKSEAKYLSLIQELQKHVSSFQDSARETQRELEAVRTEFAVMKKEVEASSRPSLQGQEWEDEKTCDQCLGVGEESSDGTGDRTSDGSSDGNNIVQEGMVAGSGDVDASTWLHEKGSLHTQQ